MAVSLASGLVFLTTSIATFKNDKIAYIFETNNSLITATADQFKKEISQATNLVKQALTKMDAAGNFTDRPTKKLSQDEPIERLEVYRIEDSMNFIFLTALNKMNPAADALPIRGFERFQKEVLVKNKLLAVIEKTVLIAETISIGSDKYAIFCYFNSDALAAFFEKNKSYSTFLVDSNGTVLKSDNSIDPIYIEQNLMESFHEKKSLNSATLKIETQDKKNWLMTSISSGYEDYFLLSLVDEETAMSALKSLTNKATLIFIIIFLAVIIIGIFSSAILTSRLSLLSEATKRVIDGDYKNFVKPSGNDEITELTANFNKMTAKIVVLLDETANKARMEGELKTAKAVQETLFPAPETEFLEAHIKGKYMSASECGGDWWHYNENNDYIFIWIADATGHGASAALLTSAAKSAVTLIETMNLKPADAVKLLNKSICSVSKENMMMTCFFAQLHKKTKILTYVNASHEPPVLMKSRTDFSKKDLIFLNDSASPRLGQSVDSEFEECTIQLDSKDRLLVYTDGIPEIRDLEGIALGERGFLKFLIQAYQSKSEFSDFTDEFANLLTHYQNNSELVDDVAFCFTEVS